MTWYRYWADPPTADGQDDPRADMFHVEQPGSGNGAGPQTGFAGPAPVVVVANQKGGVGKTTTAVNVAAAAAQRGCRTLLVDLDPQSNASSGVGCRPAPGQPTIYDVLVERRSASDVVVSTEVDGLQVMPSSVELAGAEIELVTAFSREQRLRTVIEPLRATVDLMVIDCPPSLGLLTVNALTAATDVLIPIQCEYYALEGLGGLAHNVDLIRSHLNPDLRVVGYVMTMFDGRTRLSEQVVTEVQAHFGEQVFHSRIPRSVRLAEAPSYGRPITQFDPGSRGAVAYHRLTAELLERLAATTPLEAAGRTS